MEFTLEEIVAIWKKTEMKEEEQFELFVQEYRRLDAYLTEYCLNNPWGEQENATQRQYNWDYACHSARTRIQQLHFIKFKSLLLDIKMDRLSQQYQAKKKV